MSATTEELLGDLNEIERKNAPERLYFRGERALFRQTPRVAIVGSRHATPEGLRRAGKLARALVARGAVIVSGLAEGTDTAAHRAAIEAGGRTIAVPGTPLEKPYPASNRILFDEIALRHLVVSQFAENAAVRPVNSPIRNRTMALIAHATVIVEAEERDVASGLGSVASGATAVCDGVHHSQSATDVACASHDIRRSDIV